MLQLRSTVDQLEGRQKAFEDALEVTRSAPRNVKEANQEVADLEERIVTLQKCLADAEGRVASVQEQLQRAIETRDRRHAEGLSLGRKYEAQRSAIPEVPGCPEADEEVLHQVDATIARALAVILGVLDSR